MFLDKLKHSYFACLSILILTICSLMLPIEGRCEWTYMDEGYSSFSDSFIEGHGGGWTLSGSVSASSCCASASMGPSIDYPTAFDGALDDRVADYTGGATVEASREEVTVWYSYPSYGSFHSYAQQLTFPAKTDYGNGSFLQAWVLMVKEKYKEVWWVERNDPTDRFKILVSYYEKVDLTAERETGGKTYHIETVKEVEKVVPQAQPSNSVNAYVSGRPEASKSAAVYYFYFEGNGYDSADASYTTYGE